MTQCTVTIVCPECGENDTTTVIFDEDITQDIEEQTWTTTQCANCTNPYVIRTAIRVHADPFRIIKGD